MQFTPLRISTMTCSAALRGDVDLDALFDRIALVPDDGISVGVVHVIDWRRTRARPEGSEFGTRNFGKNVSVKLSTGAANVKIFGNGGLQMTGIKTEAGGREAIQMVADIVHSLGIVTGGGAVDSAFA
jgi:hypothetical protein